MQSLPHISLDTLQRLLLEVEAAFEALSVQPSSPATAVASSSPAASGASRNPADHLTQVASR